MTAKTHYEQLELPPTATADAIKQSFRSLIARYHPDKVQHLGKEFQDIAAVRAAELTEAYRILSDAGRRADYDRTLGTTPLPGVATAPPSAPPDRVVEAARVRARTASTPTGDESHPQTGAFRDERASRDEYMRKAALNRFKHAVDAVGGGYDEALLRGFELAFVPRAKLFGRNKNPRLLGRFLSEVDGRAVTEAWTQAGKWTEDDVCVFLLGSSLAPARELAIAIAEQRRRSKSKVTLIPVDARDWSAHVPTDAPDVVKTLLARVRGGT